MPKNAELSTTFIILIVIGLVTAAIILFVTGKGAKSVQDTVSQTCAQLGGEKYNIGEGKGCPTESFGRAANDIDTTKEICCVNPFAKKIVLGSLEEMEIQLFQEKINQLNENKYAGKKVLINGCSDIYIPDAAFVMISNKLLPVVNSLMFGEACSNVPIFKKK